MKKNKTQPTRSGSRWAVVIIVLIFLALISFISSIIIGIFIATSEVEASGNVAHIMITGPIVTRASGGIMGDGLVSSTDIIKLIEKAEENTEVKALLLEINSPGGTAVASQEIADAVAKVNKSTVAWIREVGASGGYWVASSADHVIANPMTITGSLGVIGSYLEFSGTLGRYNASYQRLVSGKYKDMGTPWKKMTDDEEEVFQEAIDQIRDEFVSSVADNRGLEKETVDEMADGRFYTGRQALKLGLVDQLGGKEEAVAWIEDKEEIEADIAEYKKPKTLADIIAGVLDDSGYLVGRGMGDSLLDAKVTRGVEIST